MMLGVRTCSRLLPVSDWDVDMSSFKYICVYIGIEGCGQDCVQEVVVE